MLARLLTFGGRCYTGILREMLRPLRSPGVEPNHELVRKSVALAALTWVKRLVILFALALCFHGRGRPAWWLLLAGVLPALHCALDRTYRQRAAGWLGELWACLDRRDTAPARKWLAAACFVSLPAALLFLSTHRTLAWGDSWPVIPAACSLLLDGNLELSEYLDHAPAAYRTTANAGLPYCVQATPHGVYSSYPTGALPFTVPVVAGARLTGADLANDVVRRRLEKWAAVWLAAACLGLFFLIALCLGAPGGAWAVTFLLAAGSVMFSTVSQGLWQHGSLLFWALLALYLEFESANQSSWKTSGLQGFALGMMIPCRLSSVLFCVPFGAWVLLRTPRRALLIAAVALVTYAPWAAFYWQTYGNLFGPSTGQLAADNWSTDFSDSLLGVLFSPARGLFVYQPWLMLGFATLLPACRRPDGNERHAPLPAAWEWFCLAVIVLQIGLVSSWRCWWGGHCWGSRLLAEIVPLAGLLCVVPVARLLRSTTGQALFAALAGSAFLIHAAGVYRETCWEARVQLDQHPEMLWSWRQAPFLIGAHGLKDRAK